MRNFLLINEIPENTVTMKSMACARCVISTHRIPFGHGEQIVRESTIPRMLAKMTINCKMAFVFFMDIPFRTFVFQNNFFIR